MIRVLSILLFLAPLATIVAWRIWAPGKVPGVVSIVAIGAVIALLVGGLVWLRVQETEPPDAVYIPSRIENGIVVPDRRTP